VVSTALFGDRSGVRPPILGSEFQSRYLMCDVCCHEPDVADQQNTICKVLLFDSDRLLSKHVTLLQCRIFPTRPRYFWLHGSSVPSCGIRFLAPARFLLNGRLTHTSHGSGH
jgi:hypothetical protein